MALLHAPLLAQQLYNTVKPLRIVSLVPSQTELLHYLGLEQEVVGITKFCIHPRSWHKTKTRVGGTKTVSLEKVRALQPDLIIANREENQKEQIEALAKEFTLYLSDIYTLEDALLMIKEVGELVHKKQEALALNLRITDDFKQLLTKHKKQKALYLIWRKPWIAVGKNTFINEMLAYAGLINILSENILPKDLSRYPELNLAELTQLNPAVILLSSEPYPFNAKHLDELAMHFPKAKIIMVDGELFSWYGSRLIFSLHHFSAIKQRLIYF